jgi:hypothetical protein
MRVMRVVLGVVGVGLVGVGRVGVGAVAEWLVWVGGTP